jgi:soluble lytic murein transglycosylase-like protein
MIGPGGRGLAVAATLASVLIIALAGLGAASTIGLGGVSCGASAAAPTADRERAIPAELLRLYQAAERRYDVPWSVLAAINKVETDFGRNLGPSSAGAVGWMQFMPATWRAYSVDADGDGHADPNDPADAIFTAAAYLRASGARDDLSRAVFAYNHDDAYVERVLTTARRYAETASACTADAGAVRIAPGANRPGRPLAPETLAFLARMAAVYGGEIVVTTGTNHSTHTVDGRVSDHADGHAADLGMTANGGIDDSPIGDRLMAACLIAGGLAPERAADFARAGGLFTLEHDGLRIQCIWKTFEGGNHHDHVHAAARPL